MELLWVRDAWALATGDPEAPPPLTDAVAAAPPGVSPAERAEWDAAWPGQWRAAVHHAGLEPDTDLRATLHRPDLDPDRRRELLAAVAGPTWRDRFGDSALGDASREWSALHSDTRISGRGRRQADHEREALDALAPAWERGLTTIVTIPCRGEYTRVIGDHALLVTDETHEGLPRYRQALARFPDGPAIGAAARGARE